MPKKELKSIDPNKHLVQVEGTDQDDFVIGEWAIGQLLLNDILNIHDCYDEDGDTSISISVNANDVFAWGCADAVYVTEDELPDLYRMHQKDFNYGHIKWMCLKQGTRPQWPVARDMHAAGTWDAELDALPEREDWKELWGDKAIIKL